MRGGCLIRHRRECQAQAEEGPQAYAQPLLGYVSCWNGLELPAHAALQDIQLLTLCDSTPVHKAWAQL